MRVATLALSFSAFTGGLLLPALVAEPIEVRYVQGSSHGFAALKTLDGVTIATG